MIFKTVKIAVLFALASIAIPIGFVYGLLLTCSFIAQVPYSWRREMYEAFRSMSKILSIMAAELLNRTCINSQGVKFGTHSVSAVLGANDKENTLTALGQWLVHMLDSIEPRHCEIAAMRAGL